ncbi:MAG: hypothetical protein Q9170_007721 [Blastenia crenularia]
MASLSQIDRDIIAECLDLLRDRCLPADVSHNRAVASQAVSRFLTTLLGDEATLNSHLPTEHGDLAPDLTTLLAQVREGDFNQEHYRALPSLVTQQGPEAGILSAAFDLTIALCPKLSPTSNPSFFDASPTTIPPSSSSPTQELLRGGTIEGTRSGANQDGVACLSPALGTKARAKRAEQIYQAAKERHPPRLDAIYGGWLGFQDEFLSHEQGQYYAYDTHFSNTGKDPTGCGADRHIDLFVKPNNAESSKLPHDWKTVQVIGALKEGKDEEEATLRRIRRSVDHVFSNQPARRCIRTFTLSGDEMRTWVVNRSGPYNSTAFDIHQEPRRFIYTVAAYVMNDEELGQDTLTESEDNFAQAVSQYRADYQKVRDQARLAGRPMIDQTIDVVGDVVYYTYWYEDGSPHGQCIRLADIPGTLSGDIMRLRQDLPILHGNYEIIGDRIDPLNDAPNPSPAPDDAQEDLTALLDSLPIVEIDPDIHFLKTGKYQSEIRNLLKCQGGSCPGSPISPHIIQLLGRSSRGELVFQKFQPRWILAFIRTIGMYKSWILQLISGLEALHSLGIVHRDLRIDNLLFSHDCTKVIICDLEERLGNRLAPELSRQPDLDDAGWTVKSDIYDLGQVIKGMLYGNAPITNLVEWPVPHPFYGVVGACTREMPDDRPNLAELRIMVDAIHVAQSETES